MDAMTKKHLLEYSRQGRKAIGKFHSFRSPDKAPWSREITINYIRHRGMSLATQAIKEGWHGHLVHFVSYQHTMPSGPDIERIKFNARKVEEGLAKFKGPQMEIIYANREALAQELTSVRAAA